MDKLLISLLCLVCTSVVWADNEKKLVDLDLTKAYQQYGRLLLNESMTGEIPSVAGVPCPEAIGVHSRSVIKIDVKKNALHFKASIGVADNTVNYEADNICSVPLVDGKRLFYQCVGNNKRFVGIEGEQGKPRFGMVTFRVMSNGKELVKQTMKAGQPLQQLECDLRGVSTIELLVEDGGDGPSGDFAYWVNSVIVYDGIAPVTVDVDYAGESVTVDDNTWKRIEKKLAQLDVTEWPLPKAGYDWLINADKAVAQVKAMPDGKGIVLTNGLVARVFRVYPNLATVDLVNQMSGENMLRAVSCEGIVRIDGKNYSLGGLQGQPERGYLKMEWLERMVPVPHSFLVENIEIVPLKVTMDWARKRWALNKKNPTGKTLTFTLRGQGELSKAVVRLHYDLYDHLPTLRKRMEMFNESDIPFQLEEFKMEYLAFAEQESPVGGDPQKFRLPNISVESNYAFGGFDEKESDRTEKWVADPAYTSQCNYMLQTPCILDVSVPQGPDVTVTSKEHFSSMDVYLTPYDSDDRERKGLFKRRFYRTVAPWTTENPIFMHLTSTDPIVVKQAVEQCSEVGYEMIILSFGSGVDMESKNPNHLKQMKELTAYAHSKGIELGGYSLLSSRWISDEVDVINPHTGKRGGMIFGSSPCLCSEWGYNYFDKVKSFFEQTGFSVFEHDGSYPGNVCASTSHKFHTGLKDSQWRQWQKITELYRWMCAQGIYINVPDYYFLSGSNKVGIGYREVNWSLPRDRQLIHGRQINFVGTYDRLSSSCWTFVPLVEYHGGGPAATLEPLSEHLNEYRGHMMQNYGAGIQACYRGPRLFDTDEVKFAVSEVIDWYKKYREILNNDIIHLRKADGRDWDGFMHVNPVGKEKGLAMFFNPTDQEIVRKVHLPLYYTGLTNKARIRLHENRPKIYKLNRDYSVDLTICIPANGYIWLVIE